MRCSRISLPTMQGPFLIMVDTAASPIIFDWRGTPLGGGPRDSPIVARLSEEFRGHASVSTAPLSQQVRLQAETASPEHILNMSASPGGLEAALFENRAKLKTRTSQVAMHLDAEERRNLFNAIDRLLDPAEWEDDSAEISEKSFNSFLRFTIYAHPRRLPNLGVGPDGALLAAWRWQENSVHVEFLDSDQCTALIRSISVRGLERIAWRGHVARLREVIQNNGAANCID